MSKIPPGSAIMNVAEIRATHTVVTEMRCGMRQTIDHQTRIRGFGRRMLVASSTAAILGGGSGEAARAAFGA